MKLRLTSVFPIVVLSQIFFLQPAYAETTSPSLTDKRAFEILYYEPLPPMTLEARRQGLGSSNQNAEIGRWSFEAFGKVFSFVLKQNTRLIGKLPPAQKERLSADFELYRGELEGIPDSWIRLTKMGKQLSGMIWDGEEIYIIDSMPVIAAALSLTPPSGSSGNGLYRLSDTRDLGNTTCGLGLPGAPNSPMTDYKALLQELQNVVPAEAEGAQFNIDMAVVTDPQFAQIQQNTFGTAPDVAVIARMNVVDGIFSEQVGVQIKLVQIQELAQNGGLTSTSPSTLLDQFGNFTNSSAFDHPGVAHLFTGRDLNGSTVGIAFLSSLCSARFGIGVNQIRSGGTVGALIVAHELGHNFGAPHDNQSGSVCESTPGTFIMNPSLNNQDQFSSCSLQQMQPVVNGGSCITVIDFTNPVVTITSPADGTSVDAGTSISFSGTAADAEDGNLTTALNWTSDLDGLIGTGGSFARTLSTGTHRITASVTDSDGGTTTQVITVQVRTVVPPPPSPPGDLLFESDFDQGPEGFVFVDDPFRNTTQPAFASGAHVPAQEALRVSLGGIDDADILNMSGGWARAFTLENYGPVTITLRYQLTQASDYESDEFSQALLTIDNTLVGVDTNDFVAQIIGNGNGGPAQSTGLVEVTLTTGPLSAGPHRLTIGGFNNKKTFTNESTEVLIDHVAVRTSPSSPPPPPPPPPGDPLFESDFTQGPEGFVFVDDPFRNTTQPAFASGAHVPAQEALRVSLGGIDDADIFNMSGGWTRAFTLENDGPVTITLRYQLTQASDYESDEFSQALLTIDNTLVGVGTNDFVAQIVGNGNGGPPQSTGLVEVTLTTGPLSAGPHTLTIGGFNNKKTFTNESTEVLIDHVALRTNPSSPPPPPPPPGDPLFESDFEQGPEGFVFVDDPFRNTNQPSFSNGTYEPNQGFSGGGLQVLIGGLNNADVLNMSGGWRRAFTLPSARPLTISFRYRLTQASDYESDEFSEALLTVDNTLLGENGSETLARVTGNGNGGSDQTTGWVTVTVETETLSPGSHTMTIGAFNNKKTFSNEMTQILIDDVNVR